MNRFTVLIGLFFSACMQPAAERLPNFDTCLITNMGAVQMLEEEISETEEFMTRARMTEDAYKSMRADLDDKRLQVASLLSLRADMLRDEALDADEQAARNSVMLRNYAGGADAAVAQARANDISAGEMARQATSCAEALTE